jgi:hypothetical protein
MCVSCVAVAPSANFLDHPAVRHVRTATCGHRYGRFLLYLQLRESLHTGAVPVSDTIAVQLAGLGAQYQYGDWEVGKLDSAEYLRQIDNVANRDPAARSNMAARIEALHRLHLGRDPGQVELAFMTLVQEQPMYGVDLYRCHTSDGTVRESFVCVCNLSSRQLGTSAVACPWAVRRGRGRGP